MASTSVLSSVMDSDGKIVVPAEIQEQLGLKKGDKLEFIIKDGQTIVRQAPVSSFAEFVGAVPVFANIAEVNAWVRDMRGDDDVVE